MLTYTVQVNIAYQYNYTMRNILTINESRIGSGRNKLIGLVLNLVLNLSFSLVNLLLPRLLVAY